MALKIKDLLAKLYFSLVGMMLIVSRSNFSFHKQLKQIGLHKSHFELRILGNGESLNAEINRLANENIDYMVVNRHVLSPSYGLLKPKYYVLADPFFSSCPDGISVLQQIAKKTSWNMVLFVPWKKQYKKVIHKNCNHPSVRIIFYNSFEFQSFESFKKIAYTWNVAMPRVQNVLNACIYIGIFLHYDRIELYGTEHSWTRNLSVNDMNEVCLDNPHFYDHPKKTVQTWQEIQGKAANIATVLRVYASMFETYYELRKIADHRHVQIINRTKDSFIDAFQKQ
jgi:hypothetical protein